MSLLIMGLCASYLAVRKRPMNNVFGGLLTFYVVATARSTARRRAHESGALDWVAFLWALPSEPAFSYSPPGGNGEAEPQTAVPVGMHFFMGSVGLLAAVGDVRMLVRGGISDRSWLIRHLWRMCFGLFIATDPSSPDCTSLPRADPQAAPTRLCSRSCPSHQ